MEESKEEFFDLSKRLHQLLVDFSLRALKTFEATKGEALTPVEAKEVILHELESVKQQMSDPEFTALIIKAAKMKYEAG